MAKSLEKYPVIKQGLYKGFWSAYNVVIMFENGKESEKIKLDEGVRGSNIPCDVYVSSDGEITVQ